MADKTITQRVAALRERRAREGVTEIRGLFAPTTLHGEIKRLLREWLAAKQK